MEINQIRYMEAISKYGNFSKAAEHLYVTQPTLSQQIKKLEDEIGFPLFVRSTRTVSLTNEGKTFLQSAVPLLAAYETLLNEISQLRDNQDNAFQLGVLPTFSHLNILDTVHQFQVQNQNVTINLQIQASYGLLEMLLNGQIDVAIANLSKKQVETLGKTADIRVFSRDVVHALVNVSHPLSARSEIELLELETEPLIMLNKNSSIRNQMELAFLQTGISPPIIYDCPEIHSLVGMLQSSTAISFLSSRVASQCIQPPILSIPLKPYIETQTVVMYLKQNSKESILKRFADYFESRILE